MYKKGTGPQFGRKLQKNAPEIKSQILENAEKPYYGPT